MSDLPEWPEPISYQLADEKYVWVSQNPLTTVQIIYYEHARAEAAIARLKMAVKMLNRILPHIQHKDHCGFGSNNPNCICGALHEYVMAKDALVKIGPLPDET